MSYIRKIRPALATALFLLYGGNALAIPAKPGLITVRQADGTELQVRIVGDEHFHYYLSEDDYLLVNENDTYYYGDVDAAGRIMRSSVVAQPKEKRSTETRNFLERIDRDMVIMAMNATARSRITDRKSRMTRAQRRNVGLFDTGFPSKGEQKGLVVLVEYTDVKFSIDDPHDYFSRMLNEDGFSDYGGTGCAAEYFRESSMGRFEPQFDVYGPITLSNDMRYYGRNDAAGNDLYPWKMAVEACEQLDDTVDFSQYDRDGDGMIDNIFVFYAGNSEASGGSSSSVWPHSWYITEAEDTTYIFDGVQLDRYACSNEWTGTRPDGVGTFIHEFSHVMGLPDLYSTEYTRAFTPGSWSVLDYGPYNNDGCTPPIYSIYERYSLGWIEPAVIDGPAEITLENISTNTGCIIPTGDENEFFLLENRQQKGWDTYIPGHGMLIWHIDFDPYVWNMNTVNNTASRQHVDLEEADGIQTESTRAGDAFPGTAGITSFTDDTKPSMTTWGGNRLNLPITNITENDGLITFRVAGSNDAPDPDGVISASTEASITVSGRTIIIRNATGKRITVSTVDGRTVYRGNGSALSRIDTGSGFYIVKAGDNTMKAMVK